MASLQLNLPENITWGDYLLDGRQVTLTVEVKKTSNTKPETIHLQKEDSSTTPIPERSYRMPWCKRGNACPWSNCKFRHERCVHFDRWKATGSRGIGCRSLTNDPQSVKCPADGGCKYDHRDISKLASFIEKIEITNEDDFHMEFIPNYGLRHMYDETYDTSGMKKEDKQLLIRSLKAARDNEILQYGEDGDEFIIHFIDE